MTILKASRPRAFTSVPPETNTSIMKRDSSKRRKRGVIFISRLVVECTTCLHVTVSREKRNHNNSRQADIPCFANRCHIIQADTFVANSPTF
ncbi:hypothetical protein TNCV_4586671 [Trichonephila clavipes]|nr:hypothetical protein TNCV_4586671 [Trichonephila clavipes]